MSAFPRIVAFRDAVSAQHSAPAPESILAGQPQVTTWNHYTDDSKQFFAGIWAASRGAWRVRYTEHELCHLLAGRILIVAATGERYELAAGDTFVIPAGFVGTWEVLEDCRKLYAIFERAG
ncbi:MAG TPA: cupin domain-containing protein [Steroidobacteraceae bacterium]|nr:cupin domain-containing protein [Steroidobacteraceae bacterium]